MLQKFLFALTAGQNRLAGLSLRVFSALSLLSDIRLGRKNFSEKHTSLFNLDVSGKERKSFVTMTPGRHPRLEEWAKRTASLFYFKFGREVLHLVQSFIIIHTLNILFCWLPVGEMSFLHRAIHQLLKNIQIYLN
jgi:hypothetical protein